MKYYKTSKYPNSIKSLKEVIFKLFLSLPTSKTFPKSMTKEINTIKANTMVLDKKLFFNGFHSLENIFLLWNNLNVLKFKAMNFNIWIILNTNGSTYYRINQNSCRYCSWLPTSAVSDSQFQNNLLSSIAKTFWPLERNCI